MPTEEFSLTVRQNSGAAILDLRGEIDSSAESALTAAYAQAESAQARVILLNFKNVGYINSTGIALIVGLLQKARAGERRLMAFGLSDHYVEIFNITRLTDFMPVFPDESSALSALAAA